MKVLEQIIDKIVGRLEKKKEVLLSYRYYKCYKKYQGQKKIIHMLTPTYGNMGDQAIAYATNKFLKKYYSEYTIIEIYGDDIYKYAKAIKKILNKDDLIVLVGGGNMNNIWIDEEMRRRFVIKVFTKNTIISMPQTINFTKDDYGRRELMKTKAIYNKHKNLIVIGREKKSYDIMKSMFTRAKVLINPDMVFYLNNMYGGNEFNRKYIMVCLRNDRESVLRENKNNLINIIRDKYGYVCCYDTVKDKSIYKDTREMELKNTLDKFLKAKIVITDRLHGMIFCVITKTPCIVFKSLDHKIEETYQWIKSFNYIKFIDDFDMNRLYSLIDQMIKLDKFDYIDFDHIYFSKLPRKIES